MEHRLKNLIVALAVALAPAGALAGGFADDPEVLAFVAEMHERHGFDADRLRQRFTRIGPNETVLRAIQPAAVPELQRSWTRYRARFLNERRIDTGVRFWRQHGAALRRASALFGVPEEIIVAIIGVETEYGANTGRFGVMQALSTLAFRYPPRAAFFRGELEQFLLLARENGFDPLQVKGSYAGAIGIPQFMPGSQRHYAVDFDGDGRIDLTKSADDAIGSVASFLARHGWESGGRIAAPARVSADPAPLLALGIRPERTLAEFIAGGVDAEGDPESPGALIDLVSPEQATEYWVGFRNFYVITRYNRSSFYAMAVFQLAEAIRERRRAL
ncbi:MAG: lytic murein transglycosylase B [Rhodocyclaceae bacterium]|nr:lytic murein transglycosylase B [Rhodocyclaceae bacterium]